MLESGLEPKCHDPGTFGGFGKQITYKHTNTQDSCFISTDRCYVYLALINCFCSLPVSLRAKSLSVANAEVKAKE